MYSAEQISFTSSVRSAHVRNAPLYQDCLDLGHRAGRNRVLPFAVGCHRAPRSAELVFMLWKPVPGFLDYEVSEHGDVRHGLKYLKPERTQGNGRKRFALSVKGRTFRFKAAQLVAMAFIGPKPFRRAEVCHNNGFEHNNHYSNLRWDSRASNVADAVEHRFQRRQSLGWALPKHRIDVEASRFLAGARRR